jgi:hypothetical protein
MAPILHVKTRGKPELLSVRDIADAGALVAVVCKVIATPTAHTNVPIHA